VEGVAILAGVNRLADGFCTVPNVMGNVLHAVLLAKLESRVLEPVAVPENNSVGV
jgi:Na+/H+-dicarboxylate symporter